MKITKKELDKIIMEEIQLYEKKAHPGIEGFFNELRDPSFRRGVEGMEPEEVTKVLSHIKKVVKLASDDDVMITSGAIGNFFDRLNTAMEQILQAEKAKDDKEEKPKPKKKEKPKEEKPKEKVEEEIEIELG